MKDEKNTNLLAGLVLRTGLGLGMIYFINMFLESQSITGQVGLNAISAATSGALGIPGVGLLYGITFFQML